MSSIPGRGWSLALALMALVRASSYLFRPPHDSGLSLIQFSAPYPVWAAGLVFYVAVMFIGLYLDRALLVFLAHIGLLCCSLTFGLSIAVGALFYGQTWSACGPLVIVCLLHVDRILTVGRNLGRR